MRGQIVGKFTQRYNPSYVWTSVNPILAPGELGIESDTNYIKIGNGKTPWNELEYTNTGDSGGSGVSGKDGGYYVPSVSQTGASSMTMSFAPSTSTMPSVAPVIVTLPSGEKGEPGAKGEKGDPGPQGEPGKDGQEGITPVKGVDYYTENDKNELLQELLTMLPVYDGELVN